MGGNTRAINRQTGELITFQGRPGYADKINMGKIDRASLKRDILAALKTLDELHENEFGVPIWDPRTRDSILSSGQAFNGSSEHLFNDAISDEEFARHKPSVGDIDLTVPAENIETIFDLLASLEGQEVIPGKVWYVGQNRPKQFGEQINALFAYKPTPKSGSLFLQVDFEAVDYLGGKPTEFAKFSHSSAWEDVKSGVKGAFHKLLLRCLTTRSTVEDAVILTKSSPLYPPEKVKVAKKVSPVRALAFSVGAGMRTSVELQRYPDSPDIPPDLVGEPVKVGDKFAYKEIPPSESTYSKNIDEIFTLMFDTVPTPEDITKFGSYSGVLDLMEKYMSESDTQAVYDDFVYEKLFASGAQALDATSPEVDKAAKLAAVGIFRKNFSFLPEPDSETIEKYYAGYKVREGMILKYLRHLIWD